MTMSQVRTYFETGCWALEPGKYRAVAEVLARWEANVPRDYSAAVAARQQPVLAGGGVAVLPIYGILTQRASMLTDFSGGTSADQVGADLARLMVDPSVKAVVLDIASPGGNVHGIPELAARVASAAKIKPIIAAANAMAASAAYWIAASASEIVVTPSGEVGSIGIITMHVDESKADEQQGIRRTLITAGKYKGDGAMGTPLTDAVASQLQARADELYGMFVRSVAKGRGVSVEAVRDGFGEGLMVGAKAAVEQQMADHIGTLEDAIGIARKRATVGLDRERRVALLERSA